MPLPLHRCQPVILAAALFSFLLGCSGASTKPDVPHYAIPDPPPTKGGEPAKPAFKPNPPKVDCQQPRPPASALPQHPTTGNDPDWTIWAARVYGYVRLWYDKDAGERACLEALRKGGVIR